MYFGTLFFSKSQLCTHAHIQHGRLEVWGDKSEEKQKILGVCPSVTGTIPKKSLRDSRTVFLVMLELQGIQKLNICEFFSSKS